ncbi:MAG: class I SAM-dependent methyltransferase [Legionellaceae bacterium]|nr:class I SAM-dependent methyltransferase [Legionellaceae bacterium]
MDALEFFENIQAVFEQEYNDFTLSQTERNNLFLNEFSNVIDDNKIDASLKMTRASILFEGFYRHLEASNLKSNLAFIRAKRWDQHFGTPTVPFLLSYKPQIDHTKQLFDEFHGLKLNENNTPWLIHNKPPFVLDRDNNVISDPESISRVTVPASKEVTGVFTKTHNPFGGFTTTPCDPVSQRFIEHASHTAKTGGKVFEIGAAFGAATLEAIAKGATVFCNDIDPENLAVVRKRYLEATHSQDESITGDSSKLILIPGELPNELIGLPQKFFDAILICRVLHFFTGTKIEESLELMSKLLAPEGKIYIVCETPFLKNWQRFIPEFNNRVERGVEWPGEITNPADFESSGRAASLPKFVHWITKEVLERSLLRAGLAVEHADYINRAGQFPEDLLLAEHGKESVGAIGICGR